MGCFGEAIAASLTIDQTSCFWLATRFAGASFASILVVDEKPRCRWRGLNAMVGKAKGEGLVRLADFVAAAKERDVILIDAEESVSPSKLS
jgi:hypothetical protein